MVALSATADSAHTNADTSRWSSLLCPRQSRLRSWLEKSCHHKVTKPQAGFLFSIGCIKPHVAFPSHIAYSEHELRLVCCVVPGTGDPDHGQQSER